MTEDTATLREHSLALFKAGIAAADPHSAVRRCLAVDGKRLNIKLDLTEPSRERSATWRKIHLIAFGKAACAMAQAAQEAIPEAMLAGKGIAVTNYDNVTAVDHFQVFGAGHPLPDAHGLTAAKALASRMRGNQKDELVLTLISGGGSALLPYPVDGVSLAEKIDATRLLLSCGATINQINCVRKHLSRLKGGGLARLAAPADLHALILSDVLGDDLSAIASGPTVADDTTFADAIDVFKSRQAWDKVPPSVRAYLQQGAAGLHPETLKSADPLLKTTSHTLIGSNAISVDAMFSAAQQLDYEAQLFSKHLCGEAPQVGEQLAIRIKEFSDNGMTAATALIAGGETTVTLTGNGKGGRNQEMALAFALTAERIGLNGCWTFLSGGTDGRDGPTDAAGAVVDRNTLNKIRSAGIDPQTALDNNDSYHALLAADDLLFTGATGTNVADLQIVLLQPSYE